MSRILKSEKFYFDFIHRTRKTCYIHRHFVFWVFISCITDYTLTASFILLFNVLCVHFSRDNFNIYYIISNFVHTWKILLRGFWISICNFNFSYDIKHRNVCFFFSFDCLFSLLTRKKIVVLITLTTVFSLFFFHCFIYLLVINLWLVLNEPVLRFFVKKA